MLLQSCTSGSGKKLTFTLFDTVDRSAHPCNLLKIYKYGEKAWLRRLHFCPIYIRKPETESLISFISSFNAYDYYYFIFCGER